MVFAGFNWFLIIVTAVSTCQHGAPTAVQLLGLHCVYSTCLQDSLAAACLHSKEAQTSLSACCFCGSTCFVFLRSQGCTDK